MSMDGGTHISRCMDGGGIVIDGGASILGGIDRVGAIIDRGAAQAYLLWQMLH